MNLQVGITVTAEVLYGGGKSSCYHGTAAVKRPGEGVLVAGGATDGFLIYAAIRRMCQLIGIRTLPLRVRVQSLV
jgi:hypothetical protein